MSSNNVLGGVHKLNNEKLTLGRIVDNLWWQLFIAAFVFQLHVRSCCQKCLNGVFFAIIYLLQCCLQNHHRNHPKLHLPLLKSAESGGNNVGKLEVVLKRVWLNAIVSPNRIISCGLFSKIQILELYYHFIIMMSFSYLV